MEGLGCGETYNPSTGQLLGHIPGMEEAFGYAHVGQFLDDSRSSISCSPHFTAEVNIQAPPVGFGLTWALRKSASTRGMPPHGPESHLPGS